MAARVQQAAARVQQAAVRLRQAAVRQAEEQPVAAWLQQAAE